MKIWWIRYTCWLLTALLLTGALRLLLLERSRASALKEDTCESAAFREQALPEELYEEILKAVKQGGRFGDLLTATMLKGEFFPKEISTDKNVYVKYKAAEYKHLRQAYEAIWADVVTFPIPDRNISFEDTFGEPREEGNRVHEGVDLFGQVKTPGYYPVLSMTDGVVEQVGWLPLGGYRIGIRSPSGGYFYYAHLSGYEKQFQKGEAVSAGDILGYMGDTGYGPAGTRGRFPVHLHLGIYVKTPHFAELSVNPYYVLRAISKKFRNYSY